MPSTPGPRCSSAHGVVCERCVRGTKASVSVRVVFPQPPMTASGASRQPMTMSVAARAVHHRLRPRYQPLRFLGGARGGGLSSCARSAAFHSPAGHAALRSHSPAERVAPANRRRADRDSFSPNRSTQPARTTSTIGALCASRRGSVRNRRLGSSDVIVARRPAGDLVESSHLARGLGRCMINLDGESPSGVKPPGSGR